MCYYSRDAINRVHFCESRPFLPVSNYNYQEVAECNHRWQKE